VEEEPNAGVRHGLAASVLKDSAIADEVERLAHALAGTREGGTLLAHARAIIETEFDLRRIAQAKVGSSTHSSWR
jgi:hypothetical protein